MMIKVINVIWACLAISLIGAIGVVKIAFKIVDSICRQVDKSIDEVFEWVIQK